VHVIDYDLTVDDDLIDCLQFNTTPADANAWGQQVLADAKGVWGREALQISIIWTEEVDIFDVCYTCHCYTVTDKDYSKGTATVRHAILQIYQSASRGGGVLFCAR
jgi:hypothetical protein